MASQRAREERTNERTRIFVLSDFSFLISLPGTFSLSITLHLSFLCPERLTNNQSSPTEFNDNKKYCSRMRISNRRWKYKLLLPIRIRLYVIVPLQ